MWWGPEIAWGRWVVVRSFTGEEPLGLKSGRGGHKLGGGGELGVREQKVKQGNKTQGTQAQRSRGNAQKTELERVKHRKDHHSFIHSVSKHVSDSYCGGHLSMLCSYSTKLGDLLSCRSLNSSIKGRP